MNKRTSGFTLAEITTAMIVVSGFAVLAMVKYAMTMEKFRSQEGRQTLYTVMGAAMRYKADHGGCEPTRLIGPLDIQLRSSAYFQTPTIDAACPPNISIARTPNIYTLTLSSSTQLVTCVAGTGSCPR